MVNKPHFHEDSSLENYDRLAVATALGLDPSTLPEPRSKHGPNRPQFNFMPLTDEEWNVVRSALPKLPVPKPGADFKDRVFIDAVLWFIEARTRKHSWHRLPPDLGPQSSREHRHRRWALLDYWSQIVETLVKDNRLTPGRLRTFQQIAEDAARRKASLLERRRLTDVS